MDFTPIDTCTKTAEGQNLLVAHGTETLSLKPTLTFVPWVVYDKVKIIIKLNNVPLIDKYFFMF